MAIINHGKKEINAKLVYFGPAAAGKATNLHAICRKLKPDCRSKLKSMAVQSDRMLFFDFTPPAQGVPAGYRIRFHVYTLTGPSTSPSSWKMVLKGVDGLVFVADSAQEAMRGNTESLALLRSCLSDYGTFLDEIPCVFQFNKRDLATPLPLEDLECALGAGGAPSVSAIAPKGEGVVDSLSRLVRLVTHRIGSEFHDAGGGEVLLGGEMTGLETAPPEPEASPGAPHERTEAKAVTSLPIPPPAAAAAETAVTSDELTLAVQAVPEVRPDGELRIPLLLRCGRLEKSMTLSISLLAEASR